MGTMEVLVKAEGAIAGPWRRLLVGQPSIICLAEIGGIRDEVYHKGGMDFGRKSFHEVFRDMKKAVPDL